MKNGPISPELVSSFIMGTLYVGSKLSLQKHVEY